MNLETTLLNHKKWLEGSGGERANLSRANLSHADLCGANLSHANLCGAVHKYAAVVFTGHGECGRTLTAFQQEKDSQVILQCGCFYGSTEELREYIAKGKEILKKNRTLALDTVLMLLEAS